MFSAIKLFNWNLPLSLVTEVTETAMDVQTLCDVGVALIFAGMVIVLAAFLSFFFANAKAKGKEKAEGAVS